MSKVVCRLRTQKKSLNLLQPPWLKNIDINSSYPVQILNMLSFELMIRLRPGSFPIFYFVEKRILKSSRYNEKILNNAYTL